MSYTIAAYYHLKLRNWSFLTAFAIAIPFILVEYQFSIRGNRAAKDVLRLNAVQITLVTMTFYFIQQSQLRMGHLSVTNPSLVILPCGGSNSLTPIKECRVCREGKRAGHFYVASLGQRGSPSQAITDLDKGDRGGAPIAP